MTTKFRSLALLAAIACAGILPATAADEHNHGHAAPPRGGRMLDGTDPHAEFVVEKDRSVTITFYNHDMKPVAAEGQTVTVIADAKDGKAKIEFEKKGDALVSKGKLPEGEAYGVVVQFRQSAAAKPQNLRFKLNLAMCGECKLAEYACTCAH